MKSEQPVLLVLEQKRARSLPCRRRGGERGLATAGIDKRGENRDSTRLSVFVRIQEFILG